MIEAPPLLKELRCTSCGRIIAFHDLKEGVMHILCKRNVTKGSKGRCNTLNVLSVQGGVEKFYTIGQNL